MKQFLSDYNKYVTSILGSAIALALLWASFQFPGVVTCDVAGDGASCSVFGLIDQSALVGLVVAIISGEFVRRSSANTIKGEKVLPESEVTFRAQNLISPSGGGSAQKRSR